MKSRLSTLLPGPIAACAALALAAAAIAPPGALAMGASGTQTESGNPIEDQGSSYHYRSEITSVTPAVKGLSIQVLQFADRLLMINHTGKTVTVYGYDNEPYARVLANGTAEQNTRSPATYLNQSFYGDINVPPQANAKAPPSWQVIDRTGQLEWHDHRIHYTSPVVPPEVKDQSKRTLVFDWSVPIMVGSSRGAIAGQLFWVPENSKTPLAAIVIGAIIVLGGLALVLGVRRRRAGEPPAGPPASGAAPPDEAW
jgi:hypothetical protein